MHYGLPENILSVQGCNHESKLIDELCKFLKSKRNKSDAKQQNLEEKEHKLTDTEEESKAPVEHVGDYEGPITRSKTKKMENVLLLKANALMSNHFNDE